jgi:hypothetical protein
MNTSTFPNASLSDPLGQWLGLANTWPFTAPAVFIGLLLLVHFIEARQSDQQKAACDFIFRYQLDPRMYDQLGLEFQFLSQNQRDEVFSQLMLYFVSARKNSSYALEIPSVLVASAWQIFSQYPGYRQFCDKAFGFHKVPKNAHLNGTVDIPKVVATYIALTEETPGEDNRRTPALFTIDIDFNLANATIWSSRELEEGAKLEEKRREEQRQRNNSM